MSWTRGLLLLMVTALVQGQPQYEVQVEPPVSFMHHLNEEILSNQLADGSCCSLNETAPNCTTPCSEIQITLCFREANHSLTDTDITNCPLGMITVALREPGDLTSLNATSNATTTTYPGCYQIVYKIRAHEGLIEQVMGIQNNLRMPSGARIGGQRTEIVIKRLGVVCKEGYFGPDCGCTPQDDSTGHFTCDEDGTIVCLPGYQNTATNCVEEEVITPEPLTTNPQTETLNTDSITVKTATNYVEEEVTPKQLNTHTTMSTSTEPESPASLPIALIAGGGAGGGLAVVILIIIIILVVCVCKYKRQSARNVITVASISQEKISTSDDSVLYSETNKMNEPARPTMYSPTHTNTEQKEAVVITLNQEENIYSETLKRSQQEKHSDREPQYSTPSNPGTTPQYSVPTSAPLAHYDTPASTKTVRGSPGYSTPVSRENTLTRAPQYSAPASTLARGQHDKEAHYSTPVTSPGEGVKETTLSAKKPQVVYADLKVSTLPRAAAEHTKPVKVDKTEDVQYSEIQL